MPQHLTIIDSDNRVLAEWSVSGNIPRIGETIIIDTYYIVKDMIWNKNFQEIEALVERKYPIG